jgi:hypothetical protein
MKALESHAPEMFNRSLFVRVNPVLPPRRRVRTAKRWAIVAAHCARVLHIHIGCDPWRENSLHQWAARVVLNASPFIPVPPNWEGPAKLGGVERDAVRKLAEFVVSAPDTYDDDKRIFAAAWRLLYPKTALLASEMYYSHSEGEIKALADRAIAEWVLLDGPGFTRIVVTAESLKQIQPLVDALHFRAPEASEDVWHGDGQSTITCLDGSYTVTVDFGGDLIPAEIEDAIRICSADVDTSSAAAGTMQTSFRGSAAHFPQWP